MIADYKDSQKNFYLEIVQAVQINKRLSHAYLIETNNFADSRNLILSFAKFLRCTNHNSSSDMCNECNLCNLIDSGAENDIVIVEPDGQWIKKDQLSSIKENFKNTSVDNKLQIYIIFQAERLNKSAANSILKFLEEPENGIIAILVTSQKYNVMSTIYSRCQIYSLVNNEKIDFFSDIYQDSVDFVMNIERMGLHIIAYLPELWHNKYKTKEEYFNVLSNLEKLYSYILHLKSNNENIDDEVKELNYILSKNTIDDIIYKIKVIDQQKKKLEFNVNLSLFLDNFVIEFCGGEKIWQK